jgi:hypothetical protein
LASGGKKGVKAGTAVTALSLVSVFLFAGCKSEKADLERFSRLDAAQVQNILPAQDFVQVPAFSSTTAVVETTVETKKTGQVEIREKMFIGQVNDVYLNAEDYMGKTIKLEGLFKIEEGNDWVPDGVAEDLKPFYCYVIRYGPGGCCGFDGSVGFEIAWDNNPGNNNLGDSNLLDDDVHPAKIYPEEDAWVEAVGELKSYDEYGMPYLYLALSSLKVLDNRGAEYVSQ